MLSILLFILGLAVVKSEYDASLPPIVFLPGLTGTRLYATIQDATYVPSSCSDSNLPIGTPFSVIWNVSMIVHTQCMYDLLTTKFDASTNTFSGLEGIDIGTQHFGGFSDVAWIYWSFPRDVEPWGYELNRNLFGAPYDYRFMSNKSLIKNILLKKLII